MSETKITPPVFAVKVGKNDTYEVTPTANGVNVRNANNRSVFFPTANVQALVGAISIAASLVPTLFPENVAVVVETAAPAARAPKPEAGEIKRRQPRAVMQAARLAGEIPCLPGKDPFGAALPEGVTEWKVGMTTSQPAPDAPASQTTEF